jgi:aryl-alcohol dehydrogenase-like predicted oxidoreductase
MNARPLGNSGLSIFPLVLGGNVFGWTIDAPQSLAILDAFVARGGNLIDTADMYSRWKPGNHGGESETIIGQWLAKSGRRDQVLIATKVGMEMGPNEKGLKKPYIVQSCERSLKRLQTDRIDLYQSHQDDEGTPLEETLDAYAELMKAGKVRAIGASNYSADRLAKALEVSQATGLPRYECLQPHYNLCERKIFEAELEPLCLREKLGVIPYFSLASGFLTGKYRKEEDFAGAARANGTKKYWNDRGRAILKALDDVSASLRSTPARVALAWLLHRPSITAPIASATKVEQLEDLFAATELKLDAGAMEKLNAASAE